VATDVGGDFVLAGEDGNEEGAHRVMGEVKVVVAALRFISVSREAVVTTGGSWQ